MHERSLVLALEEVYHDHRHGEVLRRREWRRGGVDIWSQKERDDEMNKDRAKVFDDEDSLP